MNENLLIFGLIILIVGLFVIFRGSIFLFKKESAKNESVSIEENIRIYKDLIKKGHNLYLNKKYNDALLVFNEALILQKNDRIYRSLYTVYLELKDYKNAEIAIKNAILFNDSIANNWLEYAYFKEYYANASFEEVSDIYMRGLLATKDNIDLLTSYSRFLSENKKYSEAIKYLEKAININPKNEPVYQEEINRLRNFLN